MITICAAPILQLFQKNNDDNNTNNDYVAKMGNRLNGVSILMGYYWKWSIPFFRNKKSETSRPK